MRVVFPHQQDPGSSGTGISYYSDFAACPRRGNLQKTAVQEPKKALLTGQYVHMLLEFYYTDPDMSLKTFQHDFGTSDPDDLAMACWSEAVTLFKHYRQKFPRDEWRTVAAEVPYETDNATVVGVSPFTCRFDMVVEVGPEHISDLEKTRGLDLAPGMYIVDHKTTGYLSNGVRLMYEHSYQFIAYQLAGQQIYPDLQGLIVNVLQKGKTPKFESILLPPPNRVQEQALRRFLLIAKQREEGPDITIPTNENCFGMYGACPFLVSGDCRRV